MQKEIKEHIRVNRNYTSSNEYHIHNVKVTITHKKNEL